MFIRLPAVVRKVSLPPGLERKDLCAPHGPVGALYQSSVLVGWGQMGLKALLFSKKRASSLSGVH